MFAEQSKVRRQTGSCMESTVRESWLVREKRYICKLKQTYEGFVLSELPKFAMSQQTVLPVGLIFAKLSENYRICIQVRGKDSQVKTQLVLWIFIVFKVTRCVLTCVSLLLTCIRRTQRR
jgi:hypothetical protein